MRRIRDEISTLLEIRIPEDQWDAHIDLLDREGKFTRKMQIAIAIALAKNQEALEGLYEGLYYQVQEIQDYIDTQKANQEKAKTVEATELSIDTSVSAPLPDDFQTIRELANQEPLVEATTSSVEPQATPMEKEVQMPTAKKVQRHAKTSTPAK